MSDIFRTIKSKTRLRVDIVLDIESTVSDLRNVLEDRVRNAHIPESAKVKVTMGLFRQPRLRITWKDTREHTVVSR